MTKKLSHIGIAVKNLEFARKIWEGILGLRFIEEIEVAEQKVKVAIFELGEMHIELLQPLSQDSTVYKFIEKRGEGLHHLAFEVEDIESALEQLKKEGVKLIDEKPRKGAMDSKIAFIHPQSTNGVLVELCEE